MGTTEIQMKKTQKYYAVSHKRPTLFSVNLQAKKATTEEHLNLPLIITHPSNSLTIAQLPPPQGSYTKISPYFNPKSAIIE